MPEGDTIHKLAAALRPELEGQVLTQARIEGQPVHALVGQPVAEVFALGKHLCVMVAPHVLRTHLGMTGDWHRYRPGERWQRPRWQASAALFTGEREYVCFRAKEVELLDRRSARYRAFARRLGPDLLGAEFRPADAVDRARRQHAAGAHLCDVLLDQRVAAGIGNVYKSEVAFLEGLHPMAPLAAVTDAELAACFVRARGMLQRNLGPGPRRTRAARPARSARGDEEPRLWVYSRTGGRCLLCGGAVLGSRCGRTHRSTYWCASCQVERVGGDASTGEGGGAPG